MSFAPASVSSLSGSVNFLPDSASFFNADEDHRQDENDVHLELDLRLSEDFEETSDRELVILSRGSSREDETARKSFLTSAS